MHTVGKKGERQRKRDRERHKKSFWVISTRNDSPILPLELGLRSSHSNLAVLLNYSQQLSHYGVYRILS